MNYSLHVTFLGSNSKCARCIWAFESRSSILKLAIATQLDKLSIWFFNTNSVVSTKLVFMLLPHVRNKIRLNKFSFQIINMIFEAFAYKIDWSRISIHYSSWRKLKLIYKNIHVSLPSARHLMIYFGKTYVHCIYFILTFR
jgi:hypothetical protein